MTKPATPMPFVAVKPTPERLVKELSLMNDQHETWHATRAYLHKLESDRARLIFAMERLVRLNEPSTCDEVTCARALLRELGEGK